MSSHQFKVVFQEFQKENLLNTVVREKQDSILKSEEIEFMIANTSTCSSEILEAGWFNLLLMLAM